MKTFYRTTCLAMMMIGLVSGIVLAQPTRPEQPPKPPTVEEIISQLQEQLELTDEQVEQIRPIFEEEFEKREELFQKNRGQGQGPGPEARKALDAEFQKLQEETEKQLEEIFTEEQMALYRKMLEERQKHQPPQGGPQGGMPPKPKN